MTATLQTMEVTRNNPQVTRVHETSLPELQDNEVLFEVDRFALTANNISYAAAGDMLGYWKFFPAEDEWGRIPAMGFANVIASSHPDIKIGQRYSGFFPMSTHLKVVAGQCDAKGFSDVAKHREGLAPVYARFDLQSAAEEWQEDLSMLLRGLFTTSWLVEDLTFDNDFFGAEQYLITSASSKTSIALAFAIRSRGQLPTIGLTSSGNVEFVRSLGIYDHILSYDEINTVESKPSILVDMAGSKTIVSQCHNHLGDNMRYSSSVGLTHYHDAGGAENLPGAKPEFFFAPGQIEKRNADWGRGEVYKRIGAAQYDFQNFMRDQVNVVRRGGSHCLKKIYLKVLEGRALPQDGYVLSMHEKSE